MLFTSFGRFTLVRCWGAVLLAAALPAISAPAGAQWSRPLGPRFEAGGGVEYAQPVSQFRQNVRQGFGAGGHVSYRLDRAGVLSLRGDVGFITYGDQTQELPLSSIFRRITLEEETSNNIVVASIGPQLTIPAGPLRPYVNGAIGLAHFYTETTLSEADYDSGYRSTLAQATNYSDNSLVYTGGAGLYIPLTIQRQTVLLDLGARYNAVGRTRYLTSGDITEDPNSATGLIITPHESDARFVTYHVGITVPF